MKALKAKGSLREAALFCEGAKKSRRLRTDGGERMIKPAKRTNRPGLIERPKYPTPHFDPSRRPPAARNSSHTVMGTSQFASPKLGDARVPTGLACSCFCHFRFLSVCPPRGVRHLLAVQGALASLSPLACAVSSAYVHSSSRLKRVRFASVITEREAREARY